MIEPDLHAFVHESNRIEGIHRAPYAAELRATEEFLQLSKLYAGNVAELVAVYAPGKLLRTRAGMDVSVGGHYPPLGGARMRPNLSRLLARINAGELTPYQAHQKYEALHPFMDGNGRSGRAIWLWMMRGNAPLGFLHHWYYQSLQAARK